MSEKEARKHASKERKEGKSLKLFPSEDTKEREREKPKLLFSHQVGQEQPRPVGRDQVQQGAEQEQAREAHGCPEPETGEVLFVCLFVCVWLVGGGGGETWVEGVE